LWRQRKVKLHFVEAEDIENGGVDILKNIDAICVPG